MLIDLHGSVGSRFINYNFVLIFFIMIFLLSVVPMQSDCLLTPTSEVDHSFTSHW